MDLVGWDQISKLIRLLTRCLIRRRNRTKIATCVVNQRSTSIIRFPYLDDPALSGIFYKATNQGGTVSPAGGALVCSSHFCGGRTRAFLFGYVVQRQDTRLQNEEYWFKSSLTHKGKYVKFIAGTIVK